MPSANSGIAAWWLAYSLEGRSPADVSDEWNEDEARTGEDRKIIKWSRKTGEGGLWGYPAMVTKGHEERGRE